ncbi:chromatin assembly factor 1 subunit FAS1 isoform X1 [Sesbania bispinosa]|nr:chromatin assembly factor 1 subunit FAS1 isoform X1 [Sesbania bispinosa]
MADTKDDDAPRTKGQGRSTNTKKQKKNVASSLQNLNADEKEARIEDLEKELEGLFGYYKEVKDQKVSVEVNECGSRNAVIAVLMEESEFPLARLVDEIYDTLKKIQPTTTVTPASVKSCVLSVGQRLSYGVPNADADILEDHSENCFWCWEACFASSPDCSETLLDTFGDVYFDNCLLHVYVYWPIDRVIELACRQGI